MGGVIHGVGGVLQELEHWQLNDNPYAQEDQLNDQG